MRIKKYTAPTMKEALLQIKKELGEDAMILKTRKIPKNIFAIGSKDEIEVTAAVDESLQPSTSQIKPIKLDDIGVYSRPKKKNLETLSSLKSNSNLQNPNIVSNKFQNPNSMSDEQREERFRLLELKEDIKEVKDFLKSILQTGQTTAAGGFSGSWAVLYKRLIDAEIKPDIAESMILNIKGKNKIPEKGMEKRFVEILSEQFPVSGPIKQKENGPLVVAFVGPTGAGKTTTLAKLVAHCSLDKNLSVSIITADTYRIAAIEQVRTFADIVNIGLQVIFSADEAQDALESCENDDIVFVDTAGRSQRNSDHMRDLESLLTAIKPDETHLVLSATTKDSDLKDIIHRYKDYSVNRLLFTKLDETTRLGNIFNSVSRSGIPVSYFTMGQSVPNDIELARPGRFVQRLWEGSTI